MFPTLTPLCRVQVVPGVLDVSSIEHASVVSEVQSQPFSMTWPDARSSSVTPQDFCPEFDPFEDGLLPRSDFFSQHLPTLGLCVQKWHSGSRRQAAAHSSWVSAPSGYKL